MNQIEQQCRLHERHLALQVRFALRHFIGLGVAVARRPALQRVGDVDLLRRFAAHLPLIGHVQFAGVPDRSEPDRGEVDYRWLLPAMAAAGWRGWFGAEYRPTAGSGPGATEAGLGWLAAARH